MKFIITAAAALFLAVSAGAQDVNAVIDKYTKAGELVGAKEYAQAIPLLNEVITEGQAIGTDANDVVMGAQQLIPKCYFRVGLGDAKDAKWDDAIANFSKAAELGELYGDLPTMRNSNGMIAKAYTAMGAEAFNNKDYAKAAEIFSKGYAANPSDTDLALNLAMSYSEMGDTTNGYKVYREVAALTHSKYAAAVATAKEKLAYYQTLDVSKAIEDKDLDTAYALMDKILESDPGNAIVNMMYIQTATNQKNWDKVISMGEKAIAAQSTPELQSDAHFLLGAAYQNKENKAKAIENYRKVTAGNNVATAKAQIAALNK